MGYASHISGVLRKIPKMESALKEGLIGVEESGDGRAVIKIKNGQVAHPSLARQAVLNAGSRLGAMDYSTELYMGESYGFLVFVGKKSRQVPGLH